MNVINETGALPTRNHRDVQFEGAGDISAEAMVAKRESDGKANLITNAACFACTIACGRVSQIERTHYTVKTARSTRSSPAVWSTKRHGRLARQRASTIWTR